MVTAIFVVQLVIFLTLLAIGGSLEGIRKVILGFVQEMQKANALAEMLANKKEEE